MTATDHDDAEAPLIFGHGGVSEYGAITNAAVGSADAGVGSDSESDIQDGVRRIEAVSRAWSKSGLVVAYLRFGNSD